jgi:tetratricopeptide (TPR) repeat protein
MFTYIRTWTETAACIAGSSSRQKVHLVKPGQRVQLICVQDARDVIRARALSDGATVVVRTGLSRIRPIAAEIFTIEAERSWVFGQTRHLKGLITETRMEAELLDLAPLELHEAGTWDPSEHAWLFEEADSGAYDEIVAAGARTAWEMEQIVPRDAVELRWEDDPFLEAIALADSDYISAAEDLLGDLLAADLRCLDAHAHLGNLELKGLWPDSLDRAARHYRAGLAIAGLTLGRDFQGVLPWGLIDNRPYLRCLHGYGLALWQQGETEAASQVFRKMLWLNPDDNQGARFLLGPAEEGIPWETMVEHDSDDRPAH